MCLKKCARCKRMQCVRTLTTCTYYGLISRIVCTHGLAMRLLYTLLGLLPQGLSPLQIMSGRQDIFAQDDSRYCGARTYSTFHWFKGDCEKASLDIIVFFGKSSQLPLQPLPKSNCLFQWWSNFEATGSQNRPWSCYCVTLGVLTQWYRDSASRSRDFAWYASCCKLWTRVTR